MNAAPHPHIDSERAAEAYAEVQRLLDAHHAKRADAHARFGLPFARHGTAAPPCGDHPLDRAVAGDPLPSPRPWHDRPAVLWMAYALLWCAAIGALYLRHIGWL